MKKAMKHVQSKLISLICKLPLNETRHPGYFFLHFATWFSLRVVFIALYNVILI